MPPLYTTTKMRAPTTSLGLTPGELRQLIRALEVADVLQVRIAFLDSTTNRAHHSAAGAMKKRGHKR
ncbi:hypothetical protein IPG41_02310 [Candidatus Peregrinibacteria bacterium]|nr:MAG: hypothetical protein IPG41_02310 [Candidatus Peregrinibacteria bacterium]